MSVKRLLNKNFLLLFQGQLISQMGSLIFMVGLIFWLKKTTESAAFIGAFFMISTLPGVLIGPLAGTIVDRCSRKKIIILGDLINGCMILITMTVMILLPGATELNILLLLFTALTNNIVGAFFRPAVKAALPDLVPVKSLNAANGILESSLQMSSLVGQSLGGMIYNFLGLPVLMLLNGVAYIVSAISEYFIIVPQIKRKYLPNDTQFFKQLKEDTINGYYYVRNKTGLRDVFLLFTVWYFFSNTLTVLMPFFIEDELNSTPMWYGFLMSSIAGGVLIGNGLVSIVQIKPKNKHKWVVASLFFLGLSHSCIGYSQSTISALVVMIINGVSSGVLNVLLLSTIQLTTPSEIRGRVFGLLGTVTTTIAPVSMALTGLIFDFLKIDIKYLFLVSGGVMSFLAIYFLFCLGIKKLLSYEIG